MTEITQIGKVSAASILDEAKKEIVKERSTAAKTKLKAKLQQIEAAKLVLANLEREMEVLVAQVNAELDV